MADKKGTESLEKVVVETDEKKSKSLKHNIGFNLKNLFSTKKRKIIVIIISALVLMSILFAVPLTRYLLLSPFVKKDVTLSVVDSKTKKPVTNISIELGGVSSQTDKEGKVTLKAVPVGQYELKVNKQYYKSYSTEYTVPVLTSPTSSTINIDAVGRQVSVSVSDKITGDLMADVVVEANNTKATTGSDGIATIILPPTSETIKASLKKDGYNSIDVDLKIDDTVTNTYTLTPSGSIYYLSKATGKINVVKSNLDGTNSSIAVAATGQERDPGHRRHQRRGQEHAVRGHRRPAAGRCGAHQLRRPGHHARAAVPARAHGPGAHLPDPARVQEPHGAREPAGGRGQPAGRTPGQCLLPDAQPA